ncbi:lipopolysaccharide heptosyltransferase family protein [Helicobacter aurati]|uniref:Lipopolysaccharide heptosyltransferase family protein n=1 Tax=Helicobacter aurati TaxID=137778 RepID=A0A3D8J2F7_9HELI|nr:glycosyltransferase family 9 protein [Helicobacter aurati]RDU71044.1 lipopolysaccharide heptosyltransferase family protein [Helicobacter aurati]
MDNAPQVRYKTTIKQQWRRLRANIRNLFFLLCTRSKPHSKKQNNDTNKQDSILILRTDGIGDYLLFRNFLHEIKTAYPTHSITLLGNIAWQALSETLESESINNFIWLDRNRFHKNPFYALFFLRKIQSHIYNLFINPLQSRDAISETLAKHVFATYKCASEGDCVNLPVPKKQEADLIYTQLFPSKQSVVFEFYRNQDFFETLLGKKLFTKLYIESNQQRSLAKNKYTVLFIGANAAYRKWHIKNFKKVADYLIATYKMNILICGGKEDIENSKVLQQMIEISTNNTAIKVKNLVGQTTLINLLEIIQNAKLLISNETGCAHLGAIMQIPTIVISNGNHLGRFTPYPKNLSSNYYPVYHPSIMSHLENNKIYQELCKKI